MMPVMWSVDGALVFETYRCGQCGKWSERRGDAALRCAVFHRGGCCHYGETEVDPPGTLQEA